MKQGIIASQLALLILTIVGGAMLLYLVQQATPKDYGRMDIEACRLSVQAKSLSGQRTSLNCELFEKEIGEMESKEAILNAISDAVYECWYMMGEGKLNTFRGSETEQVAHCFLCSRFQMPKEFEDAQGKKFNVLQAPEVLEFMKTDRYKTNQGFVYDAVKEGLIRIDGKEHLLLRELSMPPPADNTVAAFIKQGMYHGPGKVVSIPSILLIDALFSYAGTEAGPYNNFYYTDSPVTSRADNDFVVIFYQISNYAWTQGWTAKLLGFFAEDIPLVGNALDHAFERLTEVPASKVFITRFNHVENMGCEVLQG